MKGKYANWTRGDEESLLNKHGGEEKARAFIRGDYTLVPRDPAKDLLVPVGEPVVMSAVNHFVAREAFTKANGIAYMGDNFKRFILPVVETNIPETVIQVSELTRNAENLAIAAELKVHELGRVALAHFFEAITRRLPGIRTDSYWTAAFVIGIDGETWSVNAFLNSVGWDVHACRLGDRGGWSAGDRFLSR